MDASRLSTRINMLGPWLRRQFGAQVVKIGLDAGFGCPNRIGGLGGCAFCPPAAYGGAGVNASIAEQLGDGLARLELKARRTGKDVPLALAYFQAYSSTNAEPRLIKAALEQILEFDGVCAAIVSTRPDCLDGPRWEALERFRQKMPLWLELGLQSANDDTLRTIGRGHDVACFDSAVAEAHQRGFDVVAHVVLGLPGEGPGHAAATADHLAGLGLWGVKMHNLMILEGARLAADYAAGSFQAWPLELYVQAAAEFLARLPKNSLVHRLAADPGKDTLIAPDWAADKDAILSAIADELERRDIHQGDLCPK